MRKGMVSVGIVMVMAGIAQSARAQQQSSDQRDQPPPVAAPAPAHAPAPRFTVIAGTEFLASSSYVWRGFQPNSSFSVQPNTWVKVGNVTVSSSDG